jgi:cobalt-zinc-cadmium efflux system outer membrane protein
MKRYLIIIIILIYNVMSFAQVPDEYFKIAAENNPGLQSKYLEYEAALQEVSQVNSLSDPVLSFGYFIAPAETRVGPQRTKLSLVQMFPWFGTLKSQGNAAALRAEAKFQSFIDARNKLWFQVASAYYSLFELKELIKIERENLRILESYKNLAVKKFENGTGPMVDVLRVDIMLKDAQSNLVILKDKEKPLLTGFNTLLNRPADEIMAMNDTLIAGNLSDDFRKDSLIAKNPALKALDLKLEAGRSAEVAAQKLGMPKLGLGLDYVIVSKRNDINMPDNGKDILMPMVSVSVPVFTRKYKSAVKQAQLMQESWLYQKEETENRLISDYETAWFEIRQQEQLILLYEKQLQTSQQSLNLLFASYGNSGKEFEEVLRMQQQILKYQKLSATAMSQYQTAVSRINYITSKNYYDDSSIPIKANF